MLTHDKSSRVSLSEKASFTELVGAGSYVSQQQILQFLFAQPRSDTSRKDVLYLP